MREIDTEAPVEWPAWCYSANTQDSNIDVISRKGDLASDLIPATSPSSYIQSSNTTILPVSTGSGRNRTRRKNPYTQSLTAATTPVGGDITYNNSTASNLSTTTSIPSLSPSTDISAASEKLQQHLQFSSFLINKKMLSERILMGFGSQSVSDSSNINSSNSSTNSSSSNNNNNSSNNNNNNNNNSNNNSGSKRNCDNSTTAISVYDKIKNEAQMMDPTTANVVGSSHMKNGDLNLSNKNSSGGVNSGMPNSSIKKERLSPTANGDVQSSISRSRSATPSSFPGTPPQSTHPSDLTTQNILNQSRGNDFQARNYSDFMRSLAAKYNNPNSNDSTAARNLFFDSQKYASGSTKPTIKESPSPPEVKRPSLPTPPQVPFVPPLFPGLPFPTTVFPPLIDMSSTQALVTLARAAKEAELQNILRAAQKRPAAGTTTQSLSPSLRSALTPATQPLVQFNPQSFMLPSPFQTPSHRSPSAPSPRSSHSPQQYRGEPSSSAGIPTTSNGSGSSISANNKRSSSPPLDLSSTQQSKRHKVGSSTSSPAASPPISSSVTNTDPKCESPRECQTTTTSSSSNSRVVVKESESPVDGGGSTSSRIDFPRHCRAQSDEISSWTVDDVCSFVNSIDICAEYSQKFRDQCIDGSGLPLLTEEHLTNSLGMKLGPALKLRSILAKKLGGPCPCVSCTTLLQQQQQQQQLLHQQSAMHATPSRMGSQSTIASSASTSHSGLSTSSSCATAVTMTTNPNAINNSSTNSLSNSNSGNINNSNTANSSMGATSPTATTNLSINTSNPTRPASAESGS